MRGALRRINCLAARSQGLSQRTVGRQPSARRLEVQPVRPTRGSPRNEDDLAPVGPDAPIGPKALAVVEVVGVLVAAADREHPGSDHVGDRVRDARGIAPIGNAARQPLGHPRRSNDANSPTGKTIRNHINDLQVEFPKPSKLSVSGIAKGVADDAAYLSYWQLSHDAAHASIFALKRHFRTVLERNKSVLTVDVVPPFKPKERLRTLDMACDALFGVCVGVNQLMEGTSQNDAIRALVEQFDRQGCNASARSAEPPT